MAWYEKLCPINHSHFYNLYKRSRYLCLVVLKSPEIFLFSNAPWWKAIGLRKARRQTGSDGKESAYKAGDPALIPRWRKRPGEGNVNPLQYSCWRIPWTEEPVGLQSSYSPWDHKESDMTEQLSLRRKINSINFGQSIILPQRDFWVSNWLKSENQWRNFDSSCDLGWGFCLLNLEIFLTKIK